VKDFGHAQLITFSQAVIRILVYVRSTKTIPIPGEIDKVMLFDFISHEAYVDNVKFLSTVFIKHI
jgi:hypothetical protein